MIFQPEFIHNIVNENQRLLGAVEITIYLDKMFSEGFFFWGGGHINKSKVLKNLEISFPFLKCFSWNPADPPKRLYNKISSKVIKIIEISC